MGISFDCAAPARPDRDAPGVIAPPPLLYAGGLAIGFALQAALPSVSAPAALGWVGVVLLLAGGALAASFVRAFRRAGTPVDPGSATTAIVSGGPYRLTRNPGYLGMALAYAGIALTTGSLWPLAVLPAVLVVVDRCVIAREERYLEAKFGDEYLRYKAHTRRWL